MSATTFASCAFLSPPLPSAHTRTGPPYFRMRSTRPARWYSAPNAVLKNPSAIWLLVKVFFSARWREAMAGISDQARLWHTALSNTIAITTTAIIERGCEDRPEALIAPTLPQSILARKLERRLRRKFLGQTFCQLNRLSMRYGPCDSTTTEGC